MAKKNPYQRILLKLSGEAFLGTHTSGIDTAAAAGLAKQIDGIQTLGTQVGVVVGGGNIIRGSQSQGVATTRERVDQMGMMATTLNGMMLAEALEQLGCPTLVVGAFACGDFIPSGNGVEAIDFLESGVIVIFVGGTGHPYFSTDTAAALRACEIKADVLIKATKVDGVFDKDPLKNPKAQQLRRITYTEVLSQNLRVMDGAAVSLCQENGIPIHILNIFKKGALEAAIRKQSGGSIITGA